LASDSQLAAVVVFDQEINDHVRLLTGLNPGVIVSMKTGKARNDFRGWSTKDKRTWKSAMDSIRVRHKTTMPNDTPTSSGSSLSSGSNVPDASMSSTTCLTRSQTRRFSSNSTQQNDDDMRKLFDVCEQPCTPVFQLSTVS
jgi:hypothetical protein